MSTLLIILSGAIVMTAVYCLWSGVSQAPEGFEDEAGFHFAATAKKASRRRHATHRRTIHSPVAAIDLHQPVA